METKDEKMAKNTEGTQPHQTHSFEWCWSGKKPTSVTCNKAGTVEDALRRSIEFKRNAEKMDKELVIVRDGKAISTHFPCSLIRNKRLSLKYVKAAKKQKQHGNVAKAHCRKRPSGEPIMFHLLTKGGKNVVKIMRNPAINTLVPKITVYAYKGEKVKQALRRDGRILSQIFKKNCALSNIRSEVNTEMSNLVDDLDGNSYKIILLNKFSPPESQPSSLEEDPLMQSESQRFESDENQDPVNASTTNKKPKGDNNATPEKILRDISNLNKVKDCLSSKLKRSGRGVSKLSRIQNVLRLEYGKSVQTSTEVKAMKKLMDLAGYVCQVRIDGSPAGSGFLLFDKFVLTNGHVVKDVQIDNRHRPDVRVTVNFSHESLDHSGEAEMEVEEVAGFEYCEDASGDMFDWALLRLSASHKLPDGLLKHFGFISQSGGICIIGHPDGGVKKIDSCLTLPSEFPSQFFDKHFHPDQFQFITQRFENMSAFCNRRVLTYESCFYFGSSGSPVFDKHCRVVAMHSGGFTLDKENGNKEFIVEFGYPLSFIMEHIIVQMVEERKFDVLKAYLACEYAHQNTMMVNVKKLVESRNITAFKDVANCSETYNDGSLKMFFDFFCIKEEPVPMDINN